MIDVRAGRDVLVGIATAFLTTLIGLAVVPFYVRILGVEAYGLVGFLAMAQGALQLLDFGFAPTISREVARAEALGRQEFAQRLLISVATVYWLVSCVIAIVGVSFAGMIAAAWLSPKSLPENVVSHSVVLISIVLALRWPVGIYMGALIGARRVSLTSLLNFGSATIASLGGLLAALHFHTIEAVFAMQAVAAAIQVVVFRHFAWQSLGFPAHPLRPSMAAIRSVARFSGGMALIALAAVILTQLDKFLVSRFLSLEAFGYYSLASVIGRALYQAINPVYNVVYPRFTALAAAQDSSELRRSYLLWTGMFCCLFLPASMAIAAGSEPLLQLWMRDAATVQVVAPLVSAIAIGSALHGPTYFCFALQVAYGDARTPLLINVLVVLCYAPLLVLLLLHFGLSGAAWSWPALMLIYFSLATVLTHRSLLTDVAVRWVIHEVGTPLLICTTCGLLLFQFLHLGAHSLAIQLTLVIGMSGVACICCAVALLRRHPDLVRPLFKLLVRMPWRQG